MEQSSSYNAYLEISIHALLAESDGPMQKGQVYYINFYPRSPCGERPPWLARLATRVNFYPRSPCGERRGLSAETPCMSYFYPRSPCGERLARNAAAIRKNAFLSTLSLRRATITCPLVTPHKQKFLSTLSLRRATYE